MKFTQIAVDAFQKLQLNAGVLLTDFTPDDPPSKEEMRQNIFAATSGGTSFTATPEYIDMGEDIDNVPARTKELTKLQGYEVVMSGTAKTVDADVAKVLIGACDVSGNKLTPRADLLADDFGDIWWAGDYGDKNGDSNGGYVAIHVMNALNTGGLSLQSNDDGKADLEFEFTGHYSIEDIDVVPFEVWVVPGTAEPSGATGATGGTGGN